MVGQCRKSFNENWKSQKACCQFTWYNWIRYTYKKNLKQALSHGVIKSNQDVWLKQCIDINADLRKKAENDFEKDFFKLMNNAVFEKTMENVREHRDIKLLTTERTRGSLVFEPHFYITKFLQNTY